MRLPLVSFYFLFSRMQRLVRVKCGKGVTIRQQYLQTALSARLVPGCLMFVFEWLIPPGRYVLLVLLLVLVFFMDSPAADIKVLSSVYVALSVTRLVASAIVLPTRCICTSRVAANSLK